MQASSATLVASKEHVVFCFDTLLSYYTGEPVASPSFDDAFCPLFVTWNKASRRGGDVRLRGCIGTLEPRQLHAALKDYALTSALRDRRFAPVAQREVAQLSCAVSLLHAFERGASWRDWSVGTHGLIIEFADPATKCRRTATFLPEVPAHEGWSRQQTIDALIRKAGYQGTPSADMRNALTLTRYQSTAFTMTYDEYVQLKQAAAAAAEVEPVGAQSAAIVVQA